MKQLKWDMLSKDWEQLEDFQKANLRRAVAEIGFFITTFIAIAVFTKGDDDDEDEYENVRLAYLAVRLQTEMAFYLNPLDTLKILKSPSASITMVEHLIRMIDQLITDPTEVYVRGRREGQLKLRKDIEDLLPYIKQFDRMTEEGIKEQLVWFNMK